MTKRGEEYYEFDNYRLILRDFRPFMAFAKRISFQVCIANVVVAFSEC